MKAFVFPGQGAQFVGMGKDLYESSPLAKELFEKANDILGYRIRRPAPDQGYPACRIPAFSHLSTVHGRRLPP